MTFVPSLNSLSSRLVSASGLPNLAVERRNKLTGTMHLQAGPALFPRACLRENSVLKIGETLPIGARNFLPFSTEQF
jgi:hypothetical protein